MIPNNSALSLIHYRKVVSLTDLPDPAALFERLFKTNGWIDAWRNGVYDYVHYHPRTYEVLGIARGRARVRFGGKKGSSLLLGPGDVVILPAGTGHEALSATKDLLVVGAYPPSGKYDEYQDKRAQYKKALRMISKVKLPSKDPVFGKNGPLKRLWVKKAPHAVTAAEVANLVRCGSPYDRSAPASALFKVGDKVRAKNMHPKTHTRLPRYARGHRSDSAHRWLSCVSRRQCQQSRRSPTLALHREIPRP